MLNVIQSSDAGSNSALSEGDYTAVEVEAMQRAVLNIFAKWTVKDADAAVILGGVSVKTVRRWRDGDYGRVSRDLADRLSNLLGVHKTLRIIFSDPARGYNWIRAKNGALGGLSALEVMLLGGMSDLIRVRRYLDSVRGGW